MPVIGTETEYGILAPTVPELDPAVLSAAVVTSWRGPATTPSLDWAGPIPLEDAHNRFLGNGARLYVDHAHPEFSGPECRTARDAVTYDLAGDEIVRRAAQDASATLGAQVRVFKNNTDGKGASYGFHENYLISRAVPWAAIVAGLLPYLVTRLPLTGAGRVGLEPDGRLAGFQLSQRADFFERVTALETTIRRPLVNTRDEPHARPGQWRRVHVIAGDANLAHTSRLLTVGSGAAVIAGIEAGVLPLIELADPVAAVRQVSRDLRCREPLRLADGRTITAVAVQERYLEALRAWGGADRFVLDLWEATLADLRLDPTHLADRLDWAAKLALLEHYRSRESLGWESSRLTQIDLSYADLDPARSVHQTLVRAGRLQTLIDDAAVARAVEEPPTDTRAYLRGSLIRSAQRRVLSADWGSLRVRDGGGRIRDLRLDQPLAATRDDLGDIEGLGVDAVLALLGR